MPGMARKIWAMPMASETAATGASGQLLAISARTYPDSRVQAEFGEDRGGVLMQRSRREHGQAAIRA